MAEPYIFFQILYPLFRFLDMHMYVTSALQRTDMKAVGLQLALDLLHEKVKRTGTSFYIDRHLEPTNEKN